MKEPCSYCGGTPCFCVWIARAQGAEEREASAIAEAYKFRELWEAAASCLQHNRKKIRPRGEDERRVLDIADKQMCGHFWSGKTNGWLPESDRVNLPE
jgi:hypothetical protein